MWYLLTIIIGIIGSFIAMAEAFARKMNELGFECSVYYMMD